MLNADSAIVALEDVVFFEARFVRPVEDTKVFTGRVFEAEEFVAWRAQMLAPDAGRRGTLRAETEVQISAPKDVYQEVRCWVVEGRGTQSSPTVIVSMSVSSSSLPSSSTRRMGGTLKRHSALMCAYTPRGLKIVEINTINSSAFYAADMQKLVHSLDGLRR